MACNQHAGTGSGKLEPSRRLKSLSLLKDMREEMLHFQAVLPWRCLKLDFSEQRKEWRHRAGEIISFHEFAEGYKSLAQVRSCAPCIRARCWIQ